MKLVAIDPGLKGAIARFNEGELLHIKDMPTKPVGSKNLVDPEELSKIIVGSDLVVIEQVGASPQMGVSSAFNFGHGFGTLTGVCAGLGIPCETITPQKWKAMCGLIKSPKGASVIKAKKLYPEFEKQFLKSKDGRAEAVLIGRAWMTVEKLNDKKSNS